WMAPEQRLVLLKRIHPDALQPLLIFAWYSLNRPDKMAYCAKWSPDINLRTAIDRCERWLRHLTLFLYLGTEGVLDPWLPEVN
ncbi:hypothetical protein, partial [Acinetobacter baumannii]|uniref:hypothetical protein n=1 Tax=Acinetobacter baumannii TaxID=470 RepID=UPI001C0A56CA